MVAVAEYDVHTDTWIRSQPDARQLWRQAVADVAERARAALPECNGRVEKAVQLVLAGDVTLHADGTATVASGSEPETTYTVNGTCACPDFSKAPHGGMCKHRIAVGLATRAQQLVSQKVQALDSQAQASEPQAARRVKILERTIFLKLMAHPVPPSQLEFHPVLADTDRVCKMS